MPPQIPLTTIQVLKNMICRLKTTDILSNIWFPYPMKSLLQTKTRTLGKRMPFYLSTWFCFQWVASFFLHEEASAKNNYSQTVLWSGTVEQKSRSRNLASSSNVKEYVACCSCIWSEGIFQLERYEICCSAGRLCGSSFCCSIRQEVH